MIKISPSILSADFTILGDELKSMEKAGADYLHVDVMDGNFVPNISFGMPVIKSARKAADIPFDVHLMIDSPSRYIEKFAECGADIITIHLEAEENIIDTLRKIKSLGIKAGLSIKPVTPIETVVPYLPLLDLLLIMTVEPGFGGQKFMHDMLPKIFAAAEMIQGGNYDCELEVDGGINVETAELAKRAGANVLVSGSCLFSAPDRAERIAQLRAEPEEPEALEEGEDESSVL